MNKELRNLFQKINLEITQDIEEEFRFANLISFNYSRNISKFIAKISLDNFLSIETLEQLEDKFANFKLFPIKFLLIVKNKDSKNSLDDIYQYLIFINNCKAEYKQFICDFFQKGKMTFDSLTKKITIVVKNKTEEDILKSHIAYYENKLKKYGFSEIKILTKIMNDNRIDDFEKESEKYFQEQEQIFIAANENSFKMGVEKKSSSYSKRTSYSNNSSLDTPTYEKLIDLEKNAQNVIIHGQIIAKDIKVGKSGRKIFSISITDYSTSIKCVYFATNENWCPLDNNLPNNATYEQIEQFIKNGDWVSFKGRYQYSDYDKEYVFYLTNFKKIEKTMIEEVDEALEKRIELHCHTKMSVMDGVSSASDYIKLADKWGWNAIGIMDHGNVQAFPEAFLAVKEINKKREQGNNLKVVYGSELTMIDQDELWYVKNCKNKKLNELKYVVFDLETTGLSPEFDEIIEFGAKIFSYKENTSERIDILIKPKNPISVFTQNLTHISNEMLEDKDPIEIAFPKIYEIIKDTVLVAHNANFDFNFLNEIAMKLGYEPLQNTVIDTLTLSRVITPSLKNHRLGTVAKNYHIDYDEKVAHRGDYDAEVLANILEHMFVDIKKIKPIIYDYQLNELGPDNRNENQNFAKSRGYHISVFAKNQAGIKDLYKLISKSHTETYLGHPKIFKDDFFKIYNNGNLLLGSSCINGVIFEKIRVGTFNQVCDWIKMFDFIEIQPLSVYKHLVQRGDCTEEQLRMFIDVIISFAKEIGVKICATSDAHYTKKNLKKIREIYIFTKGLGGSAHPLYDYKKRVTDFPDQHVRTTQEMLDEFSWLEDNDLIKEIVIENPNSIVAAIEDNIEPVKSGSYPPNIPNADKNLQEECYKNAKLIYGEKLPEIVEKRLGRELDSIIKHGFAVIYWISHLLVKKSLEDGYLVGSRGSVGSSFVATMSNITEVNPLKAHYRCENCKFSDFNTLDKYKCGYDLPDKDCPNCGNKLIGDGHDIPFETFLGFDGDKVPDIDLNFSGEYQPKAHNFTKEIFGEKNVFRAGTISTVANKTAFGYVKNYYESKGYNEAGISTAEIERLARLVEGTKRTTGQHPGGIIILPKEYDIEDFTPVNFPADDTNSNWLTTHFDFHSIHDNLLKMDILGHVDPTAIRMLQELTGVDPKKIPVNDKKVYNLFYSLDSLNIPSEKIENETTGAIGLPEFGTQFVRKMLQETKPKTFADLVQISGLSHGTDVYVGNAQNLINNGTADISSVIGCRDDIMVYLMSKNLESKDAFKIMENVRKGKGLTPEWIELMKSKGVPNWYIESCEKIKYMFPKAHATAYVLMAYRVAWFKIYYPIEYYATWLSTRRDVFDIETVLQGEEGVRHKIKEIKIKMSQSTATKKEIDLVPIFEVLLEMFARGIKITNIDFNISDSKNFIISENDKGEKIIYPPFSAIDSLGEAVADSIISARLEKQIKSLKDLTRRTSVNQTQVALFKKLKITDSLIDDEQMSFDF